MPRLGIVFRSRAVVALVHHCFSCVLCPFAVSAPDPVENSLGRRQARARALGGDVALLEVALDQRGVSLGRIAVAAAARKLDLHPSVGREHLLGLSVIRLRAVRPDRAGAARLTAEKALRGNQRPIADRRASKRLPGTHPEPDRSGRDRRDTCRPHRYRAAAPLSRPTKER